MKTKVIKEYMYMGCGFPIILEGAKLIHILGEWALKIRYNQLDEEVLRQLISRKVRLTGNQVRFIRLYFNFNLKDFGKRLGVSHVAVLKWEKTKNAETGMAWCIEKDIRLYAQTQLSKQAKELAKTYELLEDVPKSSNKKERIKLDARKLAA